jgi:protease I
VIRDLADAGRPIACVCHGIEILAAAGVIEGRTVTTVAKCALDARQGGATYVDREVVQDGDFVTARTWHDNAPLLREFLSMLGSHKEIGK